MCYPKPGPRCSSHARKRLKSAQKAFKKDSSWANYHAREEAEKEYLMSPEGIKKLSKDRPALAQHYQKKRDYLIALYKEELAYKEEREKNPRPKGFQDVMFDAPKKLDAPRPGVERDLYSKTVYQLGEQTYMLQGDDRRRLYDDDGNPGRKSGYVQYWLEEKGEMVGFLNTLDHGEGKKTDQVLTSIEVREGYAGQGVTSKLIEHVKTISGRPLYTNGHCTPKGFRSLRNKLPVLPGEKWDIQFDDMNFVSNDECWDKGWFRN